jgi:hypothetical protein
MVGADRGELDSLVPSEQARARPGVLPASLTDALIEARGGRYGNFEEQWHLAQALKARLRLEDNWYTLPSYVKEALDMIMLKSSRIVCGNPGYLDNWDDIQGYSKVVSDHLRRKLKGDERA